ncbi:MAG: TolC family protein [Tunicatimonas sp.]
MRSILFILVLLLLPLATLQAQEREPLSLSDAIQVGLSENFGIRIEQQNVAVARVNNTWGAAGRWPTINLSVSQNNNFRNVDNPASFLQGLTISNDVTPFVGVSWILFDGFRVVANRERLQALERLSEGNAQVVIENAVQGIITQYYLVQLEQQRLEVLDKVFQLSKDRYAYVELRSELGSAVTFDVLQEQNAFLTDSSNYVTQQITALNALRNLNLLMGQEVGERYQLTDSLEVTPSEYEIEDLYERIIANNSNLRNQYLNLEIAQADSRLAKTERYPRLSLDLNGSYNVSRQDLSNAELLRPIENPITQARTLNYAGGLTLSYLFFDGGRVRRALTNSRTQERISQLQIDELKQTLRNDLVSTYDLYNVRQKLLSISQQNVESAELNLSLAEERFRNGTINSFDYRDIQVNYLNTALSNLQAKYNLIESETELLRLTGGITNEYDNVN